MKVKKAPSEWRGSYPAGATWTRRDYDYDYERDSR